MTTANATVALFVGTVGYLCIDWVLLAPLGRDLKRRQVATDTQDDWLSLTSLASLLTVPNIKLRHG
jgi:hypothetical protein